MRCPECNQRSSVAARICSTCGHKFKHKPWPLNVKVVAGVILGTGICWLAATVIAPQFLDPLLYLKRAAKELAAGPKNDAHAKYIKTNFEKATKTYLTYIRTASSQDMAQALQKALPAAYFESHVWELTPSLKVVEVDSVLQAADFLILEGATDTKVFPIPGLEVFDAARVVNEAAGPMLIMLGHSGGQPPHAPRVKGYALLPNDIKDESSLIFPPVRGNGTAHFINNKPDIVLDLSLYFVGQADGVFAAAHNNEDSSLQQYLEWKDAKYLSKNNYGRGPFMALYAVAQCLKNPEQIPGFIGYLGQPGKILVEKYSSPDAGNFSVERISSHVNQVAYNLTGNGKNFLVEVGKSRQRSWSVVSAKSAATQTAAIAPRVSQNQKQEPGIAPTNPTASEQKTPVSLLPKPTAATPKPVVAVPVASTTKVSTPQPVAKQPVKNPIENNLTYISGQNAEISKQLSVDAVYLRDTSGTDGHRLIKIPKGTAVSILGKENGWYHVSYQGKVGFVYGGLVSYTRPGAYKTIVVTKSKAVVDDQDKPISQVISGQRLVVLGNERNNRFKVQLASGKTGYLAMDAVEGTVKRTVEKPIRTIAVHTHAVTAHKHSSTKQKLPKRVETPPSLMP